MPTSVGQQLQQARLARGLSIEEAAGATRIRPHYLRALEADDTTNLPSLVQGRGFLRNYSAFLGLDFSLLTGEQPAIEPVKDPEPALEGVPAEAGSLVPAESLSKLVYVPSPLIEEKKPAARSIVAAPPIRETEGLPTPHTDDLFKDIGIQLKKQRELLSMPLSDIERYTHVRLHYLQAMEAGDFGLLPSFTQARGMLSHYAQFLSLDADKILNRFAEALITRRGEIRGSEASPKATPMQTAGRLQRFLTMDALVGSGLVILLVIFVVWGASRVLDLTGNPDIKITPPSVAEVLLASPDAAAIPILEPSPTGTIEINGETAVQTELPPAASGVSEASLPPLEAGKVQLFIVGRNRAWMNVLVDGKPAFTGRVIPGSAYPFSADSQIELITGNAAALQIFFNQQDLGSPGAWNELVHLVYTSEGALLPTPTVTPTATRTPRISPTPTTTLTPSPGGG